MQLLLGTTFDLNSSTMENSKFYILAACVRIRILWAAVTPVEVYIQLALGYSRNNPVSAVFAQR